MDANGAQVELCQVLDRVDEWFTDIQFECPIREELYQKTDRARLATIARTTTRWFKDLSQPYITEQCIDKTEQDSSLIDASDGSSDAESSFDNIAWRSPEKVQPKLVTTRQHRLATIRQSPKAKPQRRRGAKGAATKTNKTNKQQKQNENNNNECNLDSLAKDLELLLDSDYCSKREESVGAIKADSEQDERYLFSHHNNDEIALLDTSIGSVWTIDVKQATASSESARACQYNVIRNDYHNDDSTCNEDQNLANLNEATQIPTAQDHDYLARPNVKSSIVNDYKHAERSLEMISRLRGRRPLSRSSSASVLNEDALRRYAKFSNHFMSFSMKHDRAIAVADK